MMNYLFLHDCFESVCFPLRSARIMICHLHKIDKCHACWQWYKYLALPWCFRLTNLQRPPLDLLTVLGLMGNDDTDGLTANLPSGHLEQLSWWLIEKETHHRPCIDFLPGESPPPLSDSLQSDPLASCSPWTLTWERVELEVTVNALLAHLQYQYVLHFPNRNTHSGTHVLFIWTHIRWILWTTVRLVSGNKLLTVTLVFVLSMIIAQLADMLLCWLLLACVSLFIDKEDPL